jgi:hypothetical protein
LGSQQNTNPVIGHNLDPADNALEIRYQDGNLLRIGGQGVPAAGGYVCLQTRDGLLALDPLSGRTLWTRSDIPSRCRLFGDDQHVFLVEMDRNNVPANTRAFRAQDGSTVPVPNFAAQFQRRQRVLGQLLLVSDTEATTSLLTLRLYDILAGKDVWSKTFPANSVVLRSEERDLAGVVTPEGRATVYNLRTQKEVLVGVIDPKHLEKVQQAYVLADPQLFYVVFHAQDGNVNPFLWSSLQPDSGLRSIPVNGSVYAFDRANSKLKWIISDLQSQQLVLEQWKDLPVLLFTSRYQRRDRAGFSPQTVGLECYEKTSGKTKFRQPNLGQHIQNFYALINDVRGGKIELVSPNFKLTCTLDEKIPLSDRGGRNEGKGASALAPSSGVMEEKAILPGQAVIIPAAIPVDQVFPEPPKK